MRKIAFILAGMLLATGPAFGADLMSVYQMALDHDPTIKEAEANHLAALEAKPQALAGLLPSVDLSGSRQRDRSSGSRIGLTPSGAIGSVDISTTLDSTSWQVQLRQPLFRWDRWVQLKEADSQVAQAEANYQAAGENLLVRVAQAYFDVLGARDTLESTRASKEAIGRQLDQAKKKFEVGLSAITDVQEAQAAYDQVVADEIAADQALSKAREDLRAITGTYVSDLEAPRVDMPLKTPDPDSANAWVATAMKQNLNLISARMAADVAEQEVSRNRSQYYPNVDLVASHTLNNTSGNNIFATQDVTGNAIGLQLSMNLFAGGSSSSQVSQAVHKASAAKDRLTLAQRDAERQTRDAYLGVLSGISRVKALSQAVTSAETALKATEAGLEVGTRTTVDVLTSRQNLLKNRTQYAKSRYDYLMETLRLKQAAGILDTDDLKQMNSWLTDEHLIKAEEKQAEDAAGAMPTGDAGN